MQYLDLSYISDKFNIPRELKEAVITAIDELTKKYYKSSHPPKIHNIPSEIGTSTFDQYIYLNALILRAITRSAVFFSGKKTFSLKFAHAYLQKVYEDYDALMKIVVQKTLVSKIGFPVASIAGVIFGITMTIGFTKGWSIINQIISFVSACIGIGTWLISFYKGKLNIK